MNKVLGPAKIRTVATLGNHLPRQCGIATFTTDLTEAIATEYPELECFVVAVNDPGRRHAYPPRVRYEIAEKDITTYRQAADFLNINAVDVVSVQHEYGIFGGQAGRHVLAMLRELRMPVVTTLHTILAEPDAHQRLVMEELIELSERIVVMSSLGVAILREVHGVSDRKIDLIPHGIPKLPPVGGSKERLGLGGKSVILTFGLLSPDKGIEYVIDALPEILASFPEAIYIVLGATHPHVREREGEGYRAMLENRTRQLGVESSVIFHNRFVSQAELTTYLSGTDIYITPYLKPQQITSGTLAYAVGSGLAVISTPYVYALELLDHGRGILVPWRNSGAIAREVIDLLGNDAKRLALRERAAFHGLSMTWPAVAASYMDSFEQARIEHTQRLRTAFQAKTVAKQPAGLPRINLEHLRLMTDSTGIMQHASFSVPRYEQGYCVDDNARGLMVMARLEETGTEDRVANRRLASSYLAFVSDAFDRTTGRFRNFMSYSRQWLEDCGSEDSQGRALWALGTLVGRTFDPSWKSLGSDLFHAALPAFKDFSSPRAWAFALLGINEYLRAYQGDTRVQAQGRLLAERLFGLFRRASDIEWPWFEDRVTYCNPRLSQALIASGAWLDNGEMTAVGIRSLKWLASIQTTTESYFSPIGSNGFYDRLGGAPARFDQQPVEACAMVSACLEACRVTGDPEWHRHATAAFNWFLGQNQLQQSLYEPSTGGCRDGLHEDRMNENQGAESTLSFLLALQEMRSADHAEVDRRALSVQARSLQVTAVQATAVQTTAVQATSLQVHSGPTVPVRVLTALSNLQEATQ